MGIITLSRQLTAMQLTRLDLPLDWTEQPARELNGSAKAQRRPRADPLWERHRGQQSLLPIVVSIGL